MTKPRTTPMLRLLVLSLAVVGALACTAALAQTTPGAAASTSSKPQADHKLNTVHQRMFCGDPDSDLSFSFSIAVSVEIDAILSQQATGSVRTVAAAVDQMRNRYCSQPAKSAA